ncbi:hypothetical protein HYFRA_00006621 [Hymenoscyphus fraxineus]|uniref:deoxyhypusine synthase n=1 Tax=Hymenoscyphus fraxineus TaxID=746836 RepID=A0A9N9KXD9_9HELO|nr:hypothetical protein HYFRA_00006621 [Hymenoscyphus fraxineus]
MLHKRPPSFSFSPNPNPTPKTKTKTKTKTKPPPSPVHIHILPNRNPTNKLQYEYTPLSPTSPQFPNHVIPSTASVADWDSDVEPLIPRAYTHTSYAHTKTDSYSSGSGRSVGYIPSHSKAGSYSGRYSSARSGFPRSSVPVTIEGGEELDEDAMRRFTTMPRGVGDMNERPLLLPRRYTDSRVIPAIIPHVVPSSPSTPPTTSTSTPPIHSPTSPSSSEKPHNPKRSSIFAKLRRKSKEKQEEGMEGKEITKVVYMPRGCYLRFFARDARGVYVGSEPERRWNEKLVWTPSKIIHRLGLEINDERSVLYWAAKNNIPIFCPALTDGRVGG